MDNWGDPWADNAKTPTKGAVTSPLPPSFAPAPTILGGFLDDAGWGNEDESFGDWSTATTTTKDVETASPMTPARSEPFSTEYTNHETNEISWDTVDDKRQHMLPDQDDWAGFEPDTPHDEEQVVSESSDSATTVQANDGTEPSPTITLQLETEDDSSARTSTSPSEGSHNDAPADSPRTSYEEERGGAKPQAVADEALEDHKSGAPLESGDDDSTDSINDGHAPRSISPPEVKDLRDDIHSSGTAQETVRSDSASQEIPVDSPRGTSAIASAFKVDSDLLDKLFPLLKDNKPLDDAPDDPIHSTSARKAWYRLTRKQTLREFNNGNDDDNYVRVTWSNSNIRSEVNNVVGRWAREDRIAGTGPGARASFYWDTSAPIDPKPIADLMRKRASAQAAAMVAPKQEVPPPLSTNAPAAFSWSSATVAADPWQESGPGLRSTSSPLARIDPPRAQIQASGARAASLDVSHGPSPPKHARTSTISGETPAVTSLISPPIASTKSSLANPRPAPDRSESNTTPTNDLLSNTVDDEDEWGEMVSTPTVSTPTLTEPPSRVDSRNNTIPATNVTPHSIKSIKVQDESPEAMHASPIVRLKSTISPTSALFKANSFVPIGVEQGPIGPGMLKSANRSVSNTRKLEELPRTKSEQEKITAPVPVPSRDADFAEDFSSRQTSQSDAVALKHETKEEHSDVTIPAMSKTRPMTSPHAEAPPAQANVDAWADADFSFFESALPATPQPTTTQNISDPFAAFETRDRSSSAASSAKTFTRSPPRKVPTPPTQPLTGATSQAQRRKMEEEGIIEDILRGLPDLSYMLR